MLESINTVLLELAPIGSLILGTVIAVVASRLLTKYTSKLDADTAKAINDIVMDTVAEGVGYVEQLSKNAQKRNEELKGSTKLHKAATYIRTELEKRGIVDLTNSEIQSKVESMLGQGMTDGPILIDDGGTDETLLS